MDHLKLVALCAFPLFVVLSPGRWAALQTTDTTPRQVGVLSDREIPESSGLAIARHTPNALWTHNDSGDDPRVFLIAQDGRRLRTVTVTGARAVDWEDLCSFRLDGRNWLLIGDVGDNPRNRPRKKRGKCHLYLVEEPTRSARRAQVRRAIAFTYEDGAQDCEAIAVDPTSRKVLLLSKSLDPRTCRLYEVPLEPRESRDLIARAVATVPVPLATGMDISSDGRRLVIVTPALGFVLERADGEDWSAALRRAPSVYRLPPRRQGEAVCFDDSAEHVFLTSEGRDQPIWRMRLAGGGIK